MVAAVEAKKLSKKRKDAPEEEVPAPPPSAFPQEVGLEMGSEDEGEEADDDEDVEVEAFPEIDARSDTEDEDYAADGASAEDESEEDEEDEESEEFTDEEDHHIFPQAKTVISDITGQPKRVYPEIEPDYDSDSSTEDVRPSFLPFNPYTPVWLTEHFPMHTRLLIVSAIYQCIGTTICRM